MFAVPYYRTANLGIVHMKGSKLPAPCRARVLINGHDEPCLFASEFLCDGKDEHGGTCDAPMCPAHSYQMGPNKHLCPACRLHQVDESKQRSLFTSLI